MSTLQRTLMGEIRQLKDEEVDLVCGFTTTVTDTWSYVCWDQQTPNGSTRICAPNDYTSVTGTD